MTALFVTARNETKWSDEAVSPFPIEEVKRTLLDTPPKRH